MISFTTVSTPMSTECLAVYAVMRLNDSDIVYNRLTAFSSLLFTHRIMSRFMGTMTGSTKAHDVMLKNTIFIQNTLFSSVKKNEESYFLRKEPIGCFSPHPHPKSNNQHQQTIPPTPPPPTPPPPTPKSW